MNFTVDGGYTMNILNKRYGVNLFYALCIALCVLSVVYFSRQGWITGYKLPKW